MSPWLLSDVLYTGAAARIYTAYSWQDSFPPLADKVPDMAEKLPQSFTQSQISAISQLMTSTPPPLTFDPVFMDDAECAE